MTDEAKALVERLREAADRNGKPSGAHMIDGQRMIAKHFRQSDDREARDLADIAECMAHCIENEALLFECLKTEALSAADLIETQAREIERLRGLLREAEVKLTDVQGAYATKQYSANLLTRIRAALAGDSHDQ